MEAQTPDYEPVRRGRRLSVQVAGHRPELNWNADRLRIWRNLLDTCHGVGGHNLTIHNSAFSFCRRRPGALFGNRNLKNTFLSI